MLSSLPAFNSSVNNTSQAGPHAGAVAEHTGAAAPGGAELTECSNPAGLGLSLSHISPQDVIVSGKAIFDTPLSNTGVSDTAGLECDQGLLILPYLDAVVETPPQFKYAVGGSLAKVSRGGDYLGGGKRGAIVGRSAQSRRRLLDTLHSVNREAFDSALFVTLTYPDETDPEPEKVHRDLDCFAERLRRLYPLSSVVWSQEAKPRKSGLHVGKVYFHYHLVIFGVGFLDSAWLSRAWFEVVGSTDGKHLSAGTQVQVLQSAKQGIAYVAKYLSKDEVAEVAVAQLSTMLTVFPVSVVSLWWEAYKSAQTGRTWGAFGRENLPIAFAYAMLTLTEFFNLRRQLRHFVKAEGKKRGRKVRYRSDDTSGVTAYVSDQTAIRLLLTKGGD